ncbi:MAG TPA: P63C domain-containing protein [Candidatus Streptococcus faecavium]|uniref:P63C domain-containing protein n=1 Tax=Candidatus Streptococcus faecavium TaxID=2838763 RepID=A0A9D2FVU6_9STRE|nr:P63C domain-containing protein [Candidatus Streptococcus faecavium]
MGEILKATHEGKLELGNSVIDVAVLENGQRIITQSGVFKALDRPARGNSRVIGIPTFMDAKNLQPLITQDLRDVINKIEYIGKNGKTQSGFDANILPLVSDLYLRAREKGVIKTESQLQTAQKAEILVRSLAKVGMTALVDEATGYQYERERFELQKIISAYINDELLKWQKMFPDEFYFEIFRLNGWDYTVQSIKKRPGVVGKWTNELIYKRLPSGVLEELKRRTPRSEKGNYTARFFQNLTPDIGHPELTAQIYKVIGIMRISKNWNDFKEKFTLMSSREDGQLELEIEDSSGDISPS